MRLTQHTDFGLRILLFLAAEPERTATVAEIAGTYGISRNHLLKVANHLGRLGYIETIRGQRGGVRLGRPPESIRLGGVVRDLEPDMHLVECFDRSSNECRIVRECKLIGPLFEAQNAFIATLDQYTLADAMRSPQLGPRLVELRKQAL